MKKITLLLVLIVGAWISAAAHHNPSGASDEERSVAAGQMFTGQKSGPPAAVPGVSVSRAGGALGVASPSDSSRGSTARGHKAVPPPGMVKPQGKKTRHGMVLAMMLTLMMVLAACGPKTPAVDPCQISRDAVAETIQATEYTEATVQAASRFVSTAESKMNGTLDPEADPYDEWETAYHWYQSSSWSAASAQDYLGQASPVADKCGPEASQAVAHAKKTIVNTGAAINEAAKAIGVTREWAYPNGEGTPAGIAAGKQAVESAQAHSKKAVAETAALKAELDAIPQAASH